MDRESVINDYYYYIIIIKMVEKSKVKTTAEFVIDSWVNNIKKAVFVINTYSEERMHLRAVVVLNRFLLFLNEYLSKIYATTTCK